MSNVSTKELIAQAIAAMDKSYVPYSHFHVGAALSTTDGKIYQGCNIENASYTPTNCAERTAFFRAIFDGEKNFDKICVVGGLHANLTDFCAPCGVCRQVMMEFCDYHNFEVILAKSLDEYKVYKLSEILPEGFGPSNLPRVTE